MKKKRQVSFHQLAKFSNRNFIMGHFCPGGIDFKINHRPVYLQWIRIFGLWTQPRHVICYFNRGGGGGGGGGWPDVPCSQRPQSQLATVPPINRNIADICCQTRSISLLLMSSHFRSPDHLQVWHWLRMIIGVCLIQEWILTTSAISAIQGDGKWEYGHCFLRKKQHAKRYWCVILWSKLHMKPICLELHRSTTNRLLPKSH